MSVFGTTAVTAVLALGSVGALGSAAQAQTIVRGPTHVYDDAYAKARTYVTVLNGPGGTMVRLDVVGFPRSAAGKVFGVHVHKNRCGSRPADAGPHYQNPDAPAGAPLHSKEIWLDVKVWPGGNGQSWRSVPWTVGKGDAGSVVVHAKPTDHHTGDAGDRLLCTTVPFGG